jgi:light-independent protochlorophyllide reductase subunit B
MGYEGANVIFDAWVQPLMMGLEEHLLNMFKEDFEFHPDAPASHLGAPTSAAETRSSEFSLTDAHNAGPLGASPDSVAVLEESLVVVKEIEAPALNGQVSWASDAEKELGRIPFFVRGKARRNTENYARERGIAVISVETLYEAKAHLSR